jgi:hypothetical protein
LPFIALMLVIGAIFFAGTTAAYAEDGAAPSPAPAEEADNRTLAVKEVWLTGDTLHISVKDSNTGIDQTLELNLRDYAGEGDEYVTIQATDNDGNKSNAIKFKNPYYQAVISNGADNEGDNATAPSTSAVEDGAATAAGKPFTPDGQGDVVDNATEQDGKEFFSITTDDGNVFYLIVDRRRENENVYLLNAVTEDDLGSLAKPGDGLPNAGAVETPSAASTEPAPSPEPTATENPEPSPEKGGGDASMYILIVIAALAAGGIGYYFKIVKPKKEAADTESYDEPEDYGEDDEAEYESDKEDETE